MVNPRKNVTKPTNGTDPTPARSHCSKKLAARNGTRPSRIRSTVSSNVCTMNQKRLPTSRMNSRLRCPTPCTTTTGLPGIMGSADSSFGMLRNVPYFLRRKRGNWLPAQAGLHGYKCASRNQVMSIQNHVSVFGGLRSQSSWLRLDGLINRGRQLPISVSLTNSGADFHKAGSRLAERNVRRGVVRRNDSIIKRAESL